MDIFCKTTKMFQSIEWLVYGPIFEPGTAEIRGRRAIHYVVKFSKVRDEREMSKRL
jgi:hypothetical protein